MNKKIKESNPRLFKYTRKGTKMLMFKYIYTAINNFLRYLHHGIIHCLFIKTCVILLHQIFDREKKPLNYISAVIFKIFCVYLDVAFIIKISCGMGHLQYFIKKWSVVDMFVWAIYSHESCFTVRRAHITLMFQE